MLEEVVSERFPKPVSFVNHYMLRHNGDLPPSVTQRRSYEKDKLPDVSDLQAHLESKDGSLWAQRWGNIRFYDETIRTLGRKEAEL